MHSYSDATVKRGPVSRALREWWDDFVSLTYPDLCPACGRRLMKGEEVICLLCRHTLPQTNYHLDTENPVFKMFWGRAPVHFATSFYYFHKGGKVQQLLHHLKYNGRKEIGLVTGKIYGHILKESSIVKNVDLVIPVPLHPSRERKRGYNQSDHFAEGLSLGMEKPWTREALKKIREASSQTSRKRYARWENTSGAFMVTDPYLISGKHVLLVDDVVTTGATLEACASALLQTENVKVSIATLACVLRY